jgi:V-type H+-transporting ATPase subunit a
VLGHIAGVVPKENFNDMHLSIFRATRGNMVIKQKAMGTVFDVVENKEVEKVVFAVFFSGDRSRQKIDKICDSFKANKYALPDDASQAKKLNEELLSKKKDLEKVTEKTQDFKVKTLATVVDNLEIWTDFVMKEKAIFVTLNMFRVDVTHKCLIATGWCPDADMEDIRKALRQVPLLTCRSRLLTCRSLLLTCRSLLQGTSDSRASVQSVLHPIKTSETPPTYFRNEPIAKGTQAIVDAYGTARYKEFNIYQYNI